MAYPNPRTQQDASGEPNNFILILLKSYLDSTDFTPDEITASDLLDYVDQRFGRVAAGWVYKELVNDTPSPNLVMQGASDALTSISNNVSFSDGFSADLGYHGNFPGDALQGVAHDLRRGLEAAHGRQV